MAAERRTAAIMGLSFAIATALAVGAVVLCGAGTHGILIGLQATARFAFALFFPAYVGSGAAALFGTRFVNLRRRGRELGLAFAAAECVHLILVAILCAMGAAPGARTFALFGFASFWVFTLALFSIPRLHGALGRFGWGLLRHVGLNVIAFAFAVDFFRVTPRSDIYYATGYAPFVVLCLVGPAIYVAGVLKNLTISQSKAG